MRKRRDAEQGTMEFLFVRLLEWCREEGFDYFNLGLSPLSGVGDEKEDPAVEKALNFIYEHLNQFYSFKGLHTFKSKFKPEWQPRYLIHPGAGSLPQIALAIIHANSGGTWLRGALNAIATGFRAKKKARESAAATEEAPLTAATPSPSEIADTMNATKSDTDDSRAATDDPCRAQPPESSTVTPY
jgi:hypothetical protein